MSRVVVITKDLYAIANNLRRDLGYIKIQGKKENRVLQIRNKFTGFFCAIFRKHGHSKKIEKLIESHVTYINGLGREFFVKDNGDVTELFIAAHRYNQCIQNAGKTGRSSLEGRVTLRVIDNPDVPELLPTKMFAAGKMEVFEGDQPEIVKERRLFHKHNIRRYPGDRIDHGKEAVSIFIRTQLERFLSLVGRVIEAVGRFFGCTVTAFQKYHYRSHGETDAQIYSQASPMRVSETMEPTSYWLGHASLLLNVPLRSSSGTVATFNVITDPVEGDLNAVLYPRQTKFARPMDSLPASHVYLLSHNHLDHFDKATIKKLVSQQPFMVVPNGDGHRYTKLGFENVVELNWWEKQTIQLERGDETFEMKICATPARHWAGQGPCGGHESTFLGYVIEGAEGGDIYFAGDTARLSEEHIQKLRDAFNIKWSFQPGGPDEVRKDMESTHQASVDALWMHFNLMVKKHYEEGMSKKVFLESIAHIKTLYMHTMTFKLGNLHLSDTKDSVEKVLQALEHPEQIENLKLKVYERQVFDELVAFGETFTFSKGEHLFASEVAKLLRETVSLPKIGSRTGLMSPFVPSE